ncbi:MAG TPA: M24 family metallopeptidase [bacterium]|nr:M24 family metallopeptidase [bacterium]
MNIKDEFNLKLDKIRKYLESNNAGGILLQRSDNYAWATCGGSCHVNTATDAGVAALWVGPDNCKIVTNRIEAGRQLDEEIGETGVEVIELAWAADKIAFVNSQLAEGKKYIADMPVAGMDLIGPDFIDVMIPLSEREMETYRAIGADTASALEKTSRSLKPGMSENDAAAMLASECYKNDIVPIVVLIAADDRLLRYRHPLPTGNKLEKTVMLVICGRRKGLIASCTRIVSFGDISEDLRRRHDACARVDTTFNALSKPGTRIGDIFATACDAYRAEGFDQEWLLHHQGGPTGFRSRYYTATENSDAKVIAGSAFAWNPSITGTKVEDTILAGDSGIEFITQTDDWPTMDVEFEGMSYQRPDILVI